MGATCVQSVTDMAVAGIFMACIYACAGAVFKRSLAPAQILSTATHKMILLKANQTAATFKSQEEERAVRHAMNLARRLSAGNGECDRQVL